MPLLRVQTLLQYLVAVSDRSFVRLCHILVCAAVVVIIRVSKMVIQRGGVGAHAMTHGVQELHRCIRAAVIAIDAGFDARIQSATYTLVLSTFSQAFAHSCIIHSRIVHPCNMVPNCPLPRCPLPQIQRSP